MAWEDEYPAAQRHSATSIAAAEQIKPKVLTLRELVYLCIRDSGPVTDAEIQELLEMDGSTERPRRVELLRAGRIYSPGEAYNANGRRAQTWMVTR
jgi:hypothetical protein